MSKMTAVLIFDKNKSQVYQESLSVYWLVIHSRSNKMWQFKQPVREGW